MKDLSLERLARLGELASRDTHFRQYGRRFHGDLTVYCGEQQANLRIEGGQVTAVSTVGNPQAQIRLRGDDSAWESIWSGMNGGLHRAWRHRMVQFEGDPQAIYGHWKMIWRLGDLMVAAGWGD